MVRWAWFWSRRVCTIDMEVEVKGIVALGACHCIVWLIIVCLINIIYRYSFIFRYIKMVFTIDFVNCFLLDVD